MNFDLTPGVTPQLAGTAVAWGLRILYAAAILAIGLWLAFFIPNAARRQAATHPRLEIGRASRRERVCQFVQLSLVVVSVNLQTYTYTLAFSTGVSILTRLRY